jgi:hypothetical protein
MVKPMVFAVVRLTTSTVRFTKWLIYIGAFSVGTLMAKKAIPKVEPVEEPLNEVAISFLAADVKTASAIAAGLGGLDVFFFPDRQEDLAGTDGFETMREPFLRSRVESFVSHRTLA